MTGYAARRQRWYGPLGPAFSWDRTEEGEYALACWAELPAREWQELQAASAALAALWQRVCVVAAAGEPRLLRWLGLPPATQAAVRSALRLPWLTALGRFDFVRTPAGWKTLEYNCDTPSGVVEAFLVNGDLCRREGRDDPNCRGEARLRQVLQEVLALRPAGLAAGEVVFSALGGHAEDEGTMRFWLRTAGEGSFVPLQQLRYREQTLWAAAGPVGCWFRLHPWELLAADCAEDGFPTGRRLLAALAAGRLLAVNPPLALVGQSKASMALLWQLYEEKRFFTAAERALVGTYLLPTYRHNAFAGRCAYVRKPLWGREGGGVTVHRADGAVVAGSQGCWQGPAVYQQAVELEAVTVETLAGKRPGRRLWGCFVAGGEAVAALCRVGAAVTDDGAWMMPVFSS